VSDHSQQTARAQWRTSRRNLTIGRRPLVMGILNVTPDSFSDGGRFVHASAAPSEQEIHAAVTAGRRMIAEGADIVDIGGESTRPYSEPVDTATEIGRVVPVIAALVAAEPRAVISIDTSKAAVAREAIEAGAEIVNDVTGLQGDPAMPALTRDRGVGVCVMHMRGTPQTMQDDPRYEDVVRDIERYLIERREACLQFGLAPEAICLDPGIGFGKTHEHNLELLRATARLAGLGSPILIGHSRKGFIKHQLRPLVERSGQSFDPLAGTLGVSLAVAAAGAHVVRVHDVRETVQALAMFEAAGGIPTSLGT